MLSAIVKYDIDLIILSESFHRLQTNLREADRVPSPGWEIIGH